MVWAFLVKLEFQWIPWLCPFLPATEAFTCLILSTYKNSYQWKLLKSVSLGFFHPDQLQILLFKPDFLDIALIWILCVQSLSFLDDSAQNCLQGSSRGLSNSCQNGSNSPTCLIQTRAWTQPWWSAVHSWKQRNCSQPPCNTDCWQTEEPHSFLGVLTTPQSRRV